MVIMLLLCETLAEFQIQFRVLVLGLWPKCVADEQKIISIKISFLKSRHLQFQIFRPTILQWLVICYLCWFMHVDISDDYSLSFFFHSVSNLCLT